MYLCCPEHPVQDLLGTVSLLRINCNYLLLSQLLLLIQLFPSRSQFGGRPLQYQGKEILQKWPWGDTRTPLHRLPVTNYAPFPFHSICAQWINHTDHNLISLFVSTHSLCFIKEYTALCSLSHNYFSWLQVPPVLTYVKPSSHWMVWQPPLHFAGWTAKANSLRQPGEAAESHIVCA